MTVAEALALGTVRLREAGIGSAAHDAEVLLRHVLSWDRARLLADSVRTLPPHAEASFLALLTERAARRPLQHLTGTQWFWRHEFLVTPDVLIPRPETELIVETALHRLRGTARPLIVDVGTGSGCIALSLAAERTDADVRATEVSAPALRVARQNASRLGLEGRVRFLEGDLLEPVREIFGQVDLVASNPPYVDPDEGPSLPTEVRGHEPAGALYAPGGRLGVYRRLVPQAAAALKPGGSLLLEIGVGMAEDVAGICEAEGLRVEGVVNDLSGIQRTVLAAKPPSLP